MQQDRYCRNCGQELRPEDQFCTGCGRSLHATAHVPTPEADVPVPPSPQQAESGPPSPPRATEQAASPPPQPPQLHPGKLGQFRWPLFLFLGSVIVASVLDAAADPASAGESVGFVMGITLVRGVVLLLNYVPIWLALGGLVYLVARLLGKKPPFLQVVFDWWVTVVVGIPILLSGLLGLSL